MKKIWKDIRLGAFLAAAACGLALHAAAAEDLKEPAQTLPPKVLILGVPYVSWSEAAQWRYEHKDILNPSSVATAKMIRRYWGQDGFRLFQFGSEEWQPEDWKGAKASESGTVEHPRYADALTGLASVYMQQDRPAQAERLDREALSIYEKEEGPDHASTAQALCNLGATISAQSRHAEAEPSIRRALSIWEKIQGSEHPDIVCRLRNLALAFVGQGRHAEADFTIQRGLAIAEKVHGREHPNWVAFQGILADLRASQGNAAEAESLMRGVLPTVEKKAGRDHLATGDVLKKLGTLLKKEGRDAEAEPLLQRAARIMEKSLNPDDPAWAGELRKEATGMSFAEVVRNPFSHLRAVVAMSAAVTMNSAMASALPKPATKRSAA